MHLKTSLILFCTITVLFVELNYATTTTTKKTTTTTTTKQKLSTPAKSILVGGHTPWETKISQKHQKVFNDYKNIIIKKLKEVHKVPDSFIPKAEKFSRQVVGGINYLYLVKLPTNKYAFVSIHERPWKKDHHGKDENVLIRPQTYGLNEKNF